MKSYSRSQLEHLITEWVIGANSVRNKKIIHSKLIDGYTYETIAEKHSLSVNQVKNIVSKFKHKIDESTL